MLLRSIVAFYTVCQNDSQKFRKGPCKYGQKEQKHICMHWTLNSHDILKSFYEIKNESN